MTGTNGQRMARAVVFCCSAALAFAMLTGVAFAGDSTVDATLTGGSLSISDALDAGTFTGTLTGAAQVLDGSGFNSFGITDARGTGVGWKVTTQATQFDNATVPGKDIAVNSFTMPLLTVDGNEGSSDDPGTLHAAATIDTGTSGVDMAACNAAGQGMGVYTFTATGSGWKLAVTADEYAGSYDSTVTTTLSTLAL